jgi:erythromycin esterase
MKSNYLALIAFLFPFAVNAQDAPTEAFKQWATQHVHSIASVDTDTADNADLRPLREIVGDAHLLAFGEPFHGGHEPLAIRNRLIRYAVTQLGFKAVAFEAGLTTSKRIYDHVIGRTTETEAALKEAFSYRCWQSSGESRTHSMAARL